VDDAEVVGGATDVVGAVEVEVANATELPAVETEMLGPGPSMIPAGVGNPGGNAGGGVAYTAPPV
jgi:hypothetical protein